MKQTDYLSKLIANENTELRKLHEIVSKSIKEEELITKSVYSKEVEESLPNKIADNMASFGGSWTFIITFIGILIVWIIINAMVLANKAFDPYPFILLNLILSCIAALQAPVIMMSQNRQEKKDRKRAESDYLVNLKAEIEIRNLHQKMDLLIIDQMKRLFEVQAKQLEILDEINEKINQNSSQ